MATWIDDFNRESNCVVKLVACTAPMKAMAYEQTIARTRTLPTRADALHDLLNAVVWREFPKSKWALNQLHVAAGIDARSANQRSAARDAATLFDESGALIVAHENVFNSALAAHHAHDWHALFVRHRNDWHRGIQIVVLGHGLLESLAVRPHLGLTAKALWLQSDALPAAHIDVFLAEKIVDAAVLDKRNLLPLPICGVPGWQIENQDPQFYANAQVFRPKRRSVSPTIG